MKITNLFKIAAASVFLLTSILGAVAWRIASKYSLPFSVLPILTTVLGFVDPVATYNSLVGFSTGSKRAPKRSLNSFPLLINLLLLILPTVIIALAAPALGNQRCQLRETWQAWYSAHDSTSIKAVQDTLQCCGFGQVTEMPYPFFRNPSKDKKDPGVPALTCANILGHRTPCAPAWEGELRNAAGFVVGGASLALVWKLIFLMIVVGSPKLAQRWFVRPSYGEYEYTRAIEDTHRDDERSGRATRAVVEEVHDDDEEEEQHDREALLGSQVATYNGQTNGNGSGEGGRLLPKDYGGNNQIRMYDNSLRTGLGDTHERWREDEQH